MQWMTEYLILMGEAERARLSHESWKQDRHMESNRARRRISGRLRRRIQKVFRYPAGDGSGQLQRKEKT